MTSVHWIEIYTIAFRFQFSVVVSGYSTVGIVFDVVKVQTFHQSGSHTNRKEYKKYNNLKIES